MLYSIFNNTYISIAEVGEGSSLVHRHALMYWLITILKRLDIFSSVESDMPRIVSVSDNQTVI